MAEMKKKIRKKIRAEGNTTGPRKGPPCPEHKKTMQFFPDLLVWKCIEPGCAKVSYPQTETSRGKPQVLHGTFEMVIVEETGKSFLRLVEYNILFDISDVIAAPVQVRYDEGTGDIQPYKVELELEHATLIDENSNREHSIHVKKGRR